MVICIILIIILAVIIGIAVLIYLRLKKDTKKRALKCAEEAKRFHEKLQRLSDPSHFFTDEERHKLKDEFSPLLDEVNGLYGSSLISDEVLNDLGLRDFIDERRLVNYHQFENNKAFMANSSAAEPATDE